MEVGVGIIDIMQRNVDITRLQRDTAAHLEIGRAVEKGAKSAKVRAMGTELTNIDGKELSQFQQHGCSSMWWLCGGTNKLLLSVSFCEPSMLTMT